MINVLVSLIYRMESHLIGENGQLMLVFLLALAPLFLVLTLQQIKQMNRKCPCIWKMFLKLYRPNILLSISKKKRTGHKQCLGKLPAELHSIIKLKLYVIIQEHDQFTKDTRLPAEPLIWMGNTCNTNLVMQTDLKFSLKDSCCY